MRDRIPAQTRIEKSLYTGEKITSIRGEETDQDSKLKHMNENGLPNHSVIPMFSTYIQFP